MQPSRLAFGPVAQHIAGVINAVGHTSDGRVYAIAERAGNSNVMYNDVRFNKQSASPVSGVSPGTMTTIEFRPTTNSYNRLPDRFEHMWLVFDVVNTHATIAGTLYNPINLIRNIKLKINGNVVGVSTGYTREYLKELMAWDYVLPKLMSTGQGIDAVQEDLWELRQERDTYNGITIAAAATTRVRIPIYALFRSLQDLTTKFPGMPQNLNLTFEITFEGPTGSAAMEAQFIKSSTTASVLQHLRYDNIHLYTQTAIVNIRHSIGENYKLLFSFPEFRHLLKPVDFSTNGNTATFKLSELGRLKVRRVTLAIIPALTTFNSASSQRMFSGPEYMAIRYDRAGGNDPIDFTSTNADNAPLNSHFQRWQLKQTFGGNDAIPVPAGVVDYTLDLMPLICPSITHIDFAHIDTPEGYHIMTYTDLATNVNNGEDWDITVQFTGTTGAFAGTSQLLIITHHDAIYRMDGTDNIARITM